MAGRQPGRGRNRRGVDKNFRQPIRGGEVYDFLGLRFAHDYLKRIIGDKERYARVLKLLAELEDESFFPRGRPSKIRSGSSKACGPESLEESEQPEAVT